MSALPKSTALPRRHGDAATPEPPHTSQEEVMYVSSKRHTRRWICRNSTTVCYVSMMTPDHRKAGDLCSSSRSVFGWAKRFENRISRLPSRLDDDDDDNDIFERFRADKLASLLAVMCRISMPRSPRRETRMESKHADAMRLKSPAIPTIGPKRLPDLA